MASDKPFDPYHKWLGIPPEDQPPHYYRLLAIRPFESDEEVIQSAADQRMAHVRTFQSGIYSEASQTLLNELAAARVCLLKPHRKAAYDAALKTKLAPPAASPPTPPPSPPASPPPRIEAAPPAVVSASGMRVMLVPMAPWPSAATATAEDEPLDMPFPAGVRSYRRSSRTRQTADLLVLGAMAILFVVVAAFAATQLFKRPRPSSPPTVPVERQGRPKVGAQTTRAPNREKSETVNPQQRTLP